MAAIALEGEHHVDHVLEDPRPRDEPLLRDVTDEHEGGPKGLGGRGEQRGRLAHLRDRPRRRLHAIGAQGLDRVDDDDRRSQVAPGVGEGLDPRLREHEEIPRQLRKPLCAEAELLGALFADHIQYGTARCGPGRELEAEGGRPHPGLSAEKHDRAGDEATPEDPIELGDPAPDPRSVRGLDLRETPWLRRLPRGREDVARHPDRSSDRLLDETPPGAALGAAADPARLLRAAAGAGVDGARARHGADCSGLALLAGSAAQGFVKPIVNPDPAHWLTADRAAP